MAPLSGQISTNKEERTSEKLFCLNGDAKVGGEDVC
jgi:hypothetical protein